MGTYSYNRTAASRPLHLQHLAIHQIKVQWARDVLQSLKENLPKFAPSASFSTLSHEGGNYPWLELAGVDRSDLEWSLKIELHWKGDTLYAEVTYDHPMRGKHREQEIFSDADNGMDVFKGIVMIVRGFLT